MVALGPRMQGELREIVCSCYAFEQNLLEIVERVSTTDLQDYLKECAGWYKAFGNHLLLALIAEEVLVNLNVEALQSEENKWLNAVSLKGATSERDILSILKDGHINALYQFRTIRKQQQLSADIDLVLEKGIGGILDIYKRGQSVATMD